MPASIFIGYRLKPIDNIEAYMPEFEGRKGTNDPEKIKAQIEEKQQAFIQEAANTPYLSTLDEVYVFDSTNGKAMTFKSEAKGKPPVCQRLRAYILKAYPKAWNNSPVSSGPPEAVFVGFNPRLFLKVWGLECTLPENNCALPLSLWYGNSDHRDIVEAVMPKTECKTITFETVIKRRGAGLQGEDQEKYLEIFKGWDGPGQHPEKDVLVAITLASQLGLLSSN